MYLPRRCLLPLVLIALALPILATNAQSPDGPNPSAEAQGVSASSLPAPPPDAVAVGINYGGPTAVQPQSDRGYFERVALRPHEAVRLALTGLIAADGQSITITAPDGGNLAANALSPGADRSGSVVYQAGGQPGDYRVVVLTATGQYQLNFLVVDDAHPAPADRDIPEAF